MKNLGGQILGFPAATGAARDEGVDALEVPLVQLAEPARILLGGLDQEALVALLRRDLCRRCPGPHRFIRYNGRRRQKVTGTSLC